ncbi:hypothetical protein EJ110_NYTH18257 [Nymphaea thermarum]|nr:hypothetical protein EJ110_NYTH18257 [Nymphaea thermarum]
MNVLVVLDEVDHKDQLDALVDSQSGWFSGQSITIVTCRDESIFEGRQKVVYMVPELDPAQSLKLFSQHAFKQPSQNQIAEANCRRKLCQLLVGYLCASKYLGASLTLNPLKNGSQSWSNLNEINIKTSMLELQRKFLISINDEHGTFEMHDQIRDMGRNIVQREPGTEKVEAIIFHRHDGQHNIPPLNTESFTNMDELRILDTSFVGMVGLYKNLPKSLQFLRWWQCPLKSLPIDFDVMSIVVLDLTESIIEEFLGPSVTSMWPFRYFHPQEANYSRTFSQLKVLILKDCENLKSTPDFRLIPNATKLVFEAILCAHLKTIPDISNLQTLRRLRLSGCFQLMDVPGLSKLRCLESLQLDGCDALKDMNDMMKRRSVRIACVHVPWLISVYMCSYQINNIWAESDETQTEPEEVIWINDIGGFIPRKLEDDKGKGVMIRNGKGVMFLCHKVVGRVLQVEGCTVAIVDTNAPQDPRNRGNGEAFAHFLDDRITTSCSPEKDGKGYQRIDVTFEAESDFRGLA